MKICFLEYTNALYVETGFSVESQIPLCGNLHLSDSIPATQCAYIGAAPTPAAIHRTL